MATPEPSKNYYDKGSEAIAEETPVMHKRLETRRSLTNNAERLLIVLVGLPARGKSFIARKLLNYILWRGNACRIFNVGKYRRSIVNTTEAKADFFDTTNEKAAQLREKAAQSALKDALKWLHINEDTSEGDDTLSSNDSLDSEESTPDLFYNNRISWCQRRRFQRIAIFDATNSTKARRQWILQQCARDDHARGTKRGTGVLFLESICDDQELLQENFQVKISSCPDFDHMSRQEALEDLQSRIAKYEARYETIHEDEHSQHISYIKIFNLSSRIKANHVYGRLAKVVLPAIMAWNTGSRPIFLCRAGETKAMEIYMKELQQQREQQRQQQQQLGDSSNTSLHLQEQQNGNKNSKIDNKKLEPLIKNRTVRKRGDRLGARGCRFRDALYEFVEEEGREFMERNKKNVMHPSNLDTGTSISGLTPKDTHYTEFESCFRDEDSHEDDDSEHKDDDQPRLPFPCLVVSSTMPRAIETATWKHPFSVKDVTNLNPLDMGDFAGMDLTTIRKQHPVWYKQLQREPMYTRFPGGESYGDLIDRLYPIIIDMEQQLGLAVAVSHVSVLQVLVSYFRSSPIHKCMDIEIPMHTVLKFVPLRGGGWLESQHVLLPDGDHLEPASLVSEMDDDSKKPIWGDSRSCLPLHILDSSNHQL